jgi:CSLREA domain-containing protein
MARDSGCDVGYSRLATAPVRAWQPRRRASACTALGAALKRGAGAAIAAWVLTAAVAQAATTVHVTTLTDDPGTASAAKCPGSACSLRDAIAYANANAGTAIDLPAGTSQLQGSELLITAPVTISGAGDGASGSVVKQLGASGARVFDVEPTSSGQVTISGLEITGGNVSSAGVADGAGVLIYSTASGVTVTLSHDLIDHNTATGLAGSGTGASGGNAYGGGISLSGSPALTIAGTTIASNTVTGGAGAAGNASTDGGAGGGVVGGGIQSFGSGAITIDGGSVVSGNIAISGTGGTTAAAKSIGAAGTVEGAGIDIGNIANSFAVTIADSTVAGNTATGATGMNAVSGTQQNGSGGSAYGGGIFTQMAGTIAITDTAITGNTALAGASGTGGTAATSAAADGAGLNLDDASESIRQSTISGNVADGVASPDYGNGGAIYTQSMLTLVNSTLTGNAAQSHTGGSAVAGGIWINGAGKLASDTIAGNTGTLGSNLYNWGSQVIQVGWSAISDPLGGGGNCGRNGSNGFQDLTAHGGNLEDDPAASCGFSTSTGDVVGANAMLAALASNGGPTETLLPLPGSPLLRAAGACEDPATSSSLTIDQRGDPRPAGGPCDIGAVQVQAPVGSSVPSISPASPIEGQTLTCQPGRWSADGTLHYAYAWQRDGSVIAGQTGASYTTAAADAGHGITCKVTATSAYGFGSAAAQSAAVAVAARLSFQARQSHRKWRLPGSSRRTGVPVGTTVTVTLNTTATVTLTLTPSGRHHTAAAEKLTMTSGAGTHMLRISGLLKHHKRLKPGRYAITVTATATNGSGTITVRLSCRVEP